MHPADVAEYVLGEVAELRRSLQGMPELGVGAVELEDDVDLYIGFRKVDRPRLEVAVLPGLLGPGGNPMQVGHQAIDLSQKRERELILYMNCEDLDGVPPSAELLLPDRTPLPPPEWPQDLSRQGLAHGHPEYERPFFCRRGLREYHSHPGHEEDPWDVHREAVSLHVIALELLDDLHKRWTLR
jgi:hypothetical protein